MKRKAKRWLDRAAAALASLLLLVNFLPVTAFATGDTVVISNAEQLRQFAQNCQLDTWSQGKTVLLTADIDLTGTAFTPIPTFGGTFQGGGHKILGLSVTQSGSNLGLFRYIQSGGVVQDLTVTGSVTPGGSKSTVGGIAGVNAGTLVNCVFQGTVKGSASVGGIVGRNEQSGQVSACSSSGVVVGQSRTGGIAGENLGLLLKCENRASINTTNPDLTDDSALDQLEQAVTAQDSTALLSDHSDTGGVVGYSSGVVQSCSNSGTVGYPHVGYNIGGVAGRQVGYLADCTNAGRVYGRKDVGGIVGQAEPDVALVPHDDILSQLRQELNTMDKLVDQALDHTDASRTEISAQLTAISATTDSAKDSSKVLLDNVADFADDNMDTVNSLSVAVTAALEHVSPALDDLADMAVEMGTLSDQLSAALDTLGSAAGVGTTALGQMIKATDHLRDAGEDLSDGVADLKAAADILQKAVYTPADDDTVIQQMLGDIQVKMAALTAASTQAKAALEELEDAAEDLDDALADLRASLKNAQKLTGQLGDAVEQLDAVTDTAAAMSRKLESAFTQLKTGVEELTDPGTFTFSTLGQDTRDAGNALYGSLSQLSEDVTTLQGLLDDAGDTLSADLRAISRQMNKIFNLLLDALDDAQTVADRDVSDYIEDTSDENIAQTTQGKVYGCVNTGTIEGDRNVGGIAGAMSIELDLDPEDDTDVSSFLGTYETKAILQGCINRGAVTAKKDCVGGIVGDMNLGTTLECQNYGAVTSTSGNYVGGIVGTSRATVRNNYAKCTLSGGDYVGGVAGWGETITDCAAIATITDGVEYLGAIAGNADLTGGTVTGNVFVDTGVAGIDGISYTGIAQPVSFETLRADDSYPAEFVAFTLTLIAGERRLADISFQYGDDLSLIQLPAIPEKEGYYGVWPEFDTSGVNSDLVLEAEYLPWVTLVATEKTEGKLALALAQGQFTQEAALEIAESSVQPPAGEGQTDVWEVNLTGAEVSETEAVPLRLLNRSGGKVSVWQLVDGQWQTADVQENGHYLLLTMTGSSGVFCVRAVESGFPLPLLLAAAGLAVVLLLILFLRKRKKKKWKTKATV